MATDIDSRGPDSPLELTKPTAWYVIRKTAREFGRDQCLDLAAALTYYAVLSLFPALVFMISLLGVFGEKERTIDTLLQIVGQLSPASAVDTMRGPIEQVVSSHATGVALVVGLLGALWSASGYVGAFTRAMNRIYQVQEGRPMWKLRPIQLLLTLGGLVLAAATAFMLAISGPIASAVGGAIRVGHVGLTVWNIARWPLILVFMVCAVAILYYATPNVQPPRFRWISIGAAAAIVVWIIASVLFGLYVSHFGSYNTIYGTLAGVIVFLLWLWITNVALLFGAELEAEVERGRELQAGLPAEEQIQLPPRDTKLIDKNEAKVEEDVKRGAALRQSAGQSD